MSIVPIPIDGKSVEKLIEVVSQGIGRIYEPFGTILQAKADAKAQLILTEAAIGKEALLRRAAIRLGHVEIERQENLESIVAKARLALPENVSEEPVSKEWISQFFLSAQDISSEELKNIWAKLLAGEVAKPGVYSRRFIEFLRSVNQQEANEFVKFLGVVLRDASGWGIYIHGNVTDAALKDVSMNHLQDIGLIALAGLRELPNFTGLEVEYGGKRYRFTGPPPRLPFAPGMEPLERFVGVGRLTYMGMQLASISSQPEIAGYFSGLTTELQEKHAIKIEQIG